MADADDLEAPEEAELGTLTPPPHRKPPAKHTIESLRLNILEAEAGKTWLLLPPEYRGVREVQRYPLPSKSEELARLADIPCTRGADNSGVRYIRRAKRRVKAMALNHDIARLEVPVAKAEEEAAKVEALGKEFHRQVEVEMAKVRVAAAATLTSMGDINTLAKGLVRKMMEAYDEGRDLHGEMITQKTASDLIGKVFTHVARLGGAAIDKDATTEAEDSIMAEFTAATRARLAKEGGDDGKPH